MTRKFSALVVLLVFAFASPASAKHSHRTDHVTTKKSCTVKRHGKKVKVKCKTTRKTSSSSSGSSGKSPAPVVSPSGTPIPVQGSPAPSAPAGGSSATPPSGSGSTATPPSDSTTTSPSAPVGAADANSCRYTVAATGGPNGRSQLDAPSPTTGWSYEGIATDFGDGSPFVETVGAQVQTHAYNAAGSYQIKVYGVFNTADGQRTTVLCTDPDPNHTGVITVSSGNSTGSGSSTPDGSNNSCRYTVSATGNLGARSQLDAPNAVSGWTYDGIATDFGDGSPATESGNQAQVQTHTYTTAGSKQTIIYGVFRRSSDSSLFAVRCTDPDPNHTGVITVT